MDPLYIGFKFVVYLFLLVTIVGVLLTFRFWYLLKAKSPDVYLQLGKPSIFGFETPFDTTIFRYFRFLFSSQAANLNDAQARKYVKLIRFLAVANVLLFVLLAIGIFLNLNQSSEIRLFN